jgi:hypothetical protein
MHAYSSAVSSTNTYSTPWISLSGRSRYNVSAVYEFTGTPEGELVVEFTNSTQQDRDRGLALISEMEVVDHTGTPSPIVISGEVTDDILLRDLTGGAVRFTYRNASSTGAFRIEFESRPL